MGVWLWSREGVPRTSGSRRCRKRWWTLERIEKTQQAGAKDTEDKFTFKLVSQDMRAELRYASTTHVKVASIYWRGVLRQPEAVVLPLSHFGGRGRTHGCLWWRRVLGFPKVAQNMILKMALFL